jgi:hypothetical protein
MKTQPRRGWSPTSDAPDTRPWYRQFWPWFLILLPAASVVGGITTLLISMRDPDGLVADDYYKAGLAINRVIAREEAARRLGVTARGRLDAGTGDLLLEVQGQSLPADGLALRLAHATRSQHDQILALRRVSPGRYAAQLAEPLRPGAWTLVLEPGDGTWRVTGRVAVDGAGAPVPLALNP